MLRMRTTAYWHVRSGLAFEAQRVFEVERDDRVARELEHEVAQRADGDLLGDLLALGFVAARLARVHFGSRGGNQLVDQVVGLDAEALAAADFDVRPAAILFGNVVAKFHRAARRERDHLVAEVRVVIGLRRCSPCRAAPGSRWPADRPGAHRSRCRSPCAPPKCG